MGIHARTALLPEGWRGDVRLEIADGRFTEVAPGAPPQPDDELHEVVVPGMPNLHSHAFQRAMAGLAERRGTQADSFWTWRELMYRFALQLTPEQVEAIAAQLYVEMLESGFTRVGEFHYLHHDRDGRPYADIGEMANSIAGAASETGIALTLLPVFYAHAGFGGLPALDGQRRFLSDGEGYGRLLQRSKTVVRDLPGSVVGVAPHSLRAITPAELEAVVELANGGPIHIHVAEQVREVDECMAWSGARPVAWLLDHAAVGENWCLIHATHMNPAETALLAGSGAVAGLCPITEANLGDGTFEATDFIAGGGRFGIGSDSNVQIGLGDELRQLEYSQRLSRRSRNVLATSGGSTGRALFDGARAGGIAALGGGERGLTAGGSADCVSLDLSGAPYLAGDAILDALIFARSVSVDCAWRNGRKLVQGGRHFRREQIAGRFASAMRSLLTETGQSA